MYDRIWGTVIKHQGAAAWRVEQPWKCPLPEPWAPAQPRLGCAGSPCHQCQFWGGNASFFWLRYPMKCMNLWHSRPPVKPSYVDWIWFISVYTLYYSIYDNKCSLNKKYVSPFKDSTTFTMRGLSDSKEIRALSAVLQAFDTMAMIERVPWGVACCAAGNHVVPTTVSSNIATEKKNKLNGSKWMFMAGKSIINGYQRCIFQPFLITGG